MIDAARTHLIEQLRELSMVPLCCEEQDGVYQARTEIDALMTGPVRKMPSIIVVGDDDVIGFTPAPATPEPILLEPATPARPRGLLNFWPFSR